MGWLAASLAWAGPGCAGPAPAAAEKAGNLGEMREWLNQRSQERKKLGLPGADMAGKRHAAAVRPLAQPPPLAKAEETRPSRPEPPPETGRGPDGRIHHRLLLNEEGPDQLQVYTPLGYAAPAGDAAKLEQLTARGKRAWMAGSALRDPASYWSAKKTGRKD